MQEKDQKFIIMAKRRSSSFIKKSMTMKKRTDHKEDINN